MKIRKLQIWNRPRNLLFFLLEERGCSCRCSCFYCSEKRNPKRVHNIQQTEWKKITRKRSYQETDKKQTSNCPSWVASRFEIELRIIYTKATSSAKNPNHFCQFTRSFKFLLFPPHYRSPNEIIQRKSSNFCCKKEGWAWVSFSC